MSLYWDRNIPQPSIYSSGTTIRLDMSAEPFSIYVCQTPLYNPDILVGDVILAIGDLKSPHPHHTGEAEKRNVLERYTTVQ